MANLGAIMSVVSAGAKVVSDNKEVIQDSTKLVTEAVQKKTKNKDDKTRLREYQMWVKYGKPDIGDFALMLSDYSGRSVDSIIENIQSVYDENKSQSKDIGKLNAREFIEECLCWSEFAGLFGANTATEVGFSMDLYAELIYRLNNMEYDSRLRKIVLDALVECNGELTEIHPTQVMMLRNMIRIYVFSAPVVYTAVVDSLPKIYSLFQSISDKLAYAYMDSVNK